MNARFTCVFCEGRESARTFATREMMLGLRELFHYHECRRCGALQIAEFPPDLSRYYPSDYYSYNPFILAEPALKRWAKRARFRFALEGRGILGRLLVSKWGIPPLAIRFKRASLRLRDPVLDVGCGAGAFLLQLNDLGFTDLTGVDPYVAEDKQITSSIRIRKRQLHEIDGRFQLITFNHSLEHLRSPADELRSARRLLSESGAVQVRIPVAGSFSWRHYGPNWVALDPPRHLAIPTVAGMHRLADRIGFEIVHVEYESRAFQFWGSEQYLRDIPLHDPRSYAFNQSSGIFTRDEIRRFHTRAAELNQSGDGDEACFLLRKASMPPSPSG